MPEATSRPGAVPEVLRSRDFKGLEVWDQAGDKVGTVADLLIDRQGSLRFLDVDQGLMRSHLLVPVREVTWGERAYVLNRWTKEQIKGLPAYQPDQPLTGAMLEEMARAHPRFYGDEASVPVIVPGSEARVIPLSQAKDFKLEAGAPDLRGWNVFGADGERLGTVKELFVDPAELRIRYLEVDLLEDLFLLKEDRHVLVPLEYVDLKERGNDVWVQRLPAAQVARFPAYTGGPVDPAMERAVNAPFQGWPGA